VLKFDRSSDVLYGGQRLEITQDVIKGLNEAYQMEKNGTASKVNAKADSTSKRK